MWVFFKYLYTKKSYFTKLCWYDPNCKDLVGRGTTVAFSYTVKLIYFNLFCYLRPQNVDFSNLSLKIADTKS